MANNYSTKQKELIFSYIQKQSNRFTIYNIKEALTDKVGLTTIYRYVDELVQKQIIKKYYDNSTASFQYILDRYNQNNHYYLKCNLCGNIIHISCKCIKDFSTHINTNHNFKVENCSIIINGTCQDCRN